MEHRTTDSFSSIRAVIFDFDGTIVPSMQAYGKIAAQLIADAYGIASENAFKEYMDSSGLPFPEQLILIAGDKPQNVDINSAFEKEKQKILFAIEPEKDAQKTVSALHQKGIATAISSNNTENLLHEFVMRHNLTFDFVLGYRGPYFKKGKDHFSFLSTQLQCSASQLLFVADSLKDAEIARENAVPFIGKLGTFTRTRFNDSFPGCILIEQLSSLLPLLEAQKHQYVSKT